MSPNILKPKKAFTLVELIFEIAILALVVLSTAMLLGQLSLNVIETETNSLATALGIEKSEEMLSNYRQNGFGAVVSVPATLFPAPFQDYSYTIDVQNVVSNPLQPGIIDKQVTITVSNPNIVDVVIDLLIVN